jgi:hypothetical protein
LISGRAADVVTARCRLGGGYSDPMRPNPIGAADIRSYLAASVW